MAFDSTIIGLVMMRARHAAEKYEKATMQPQQAQVDKLLSIVEKNRIPSMERSTVFRR